MQKNSETTTTPSSGPVLRPYQQRAAEQLAGALEQHGVAVDLSSTGLGKSFHALAVVQKFGAPFAVICRASARHKWQLLVGSFGLAANCLAVDSWQKFTSGRHHQQLVVKQGSGKAAVFAWRPKDPTIVIFDEVQDAGGQDTLNAKLLAACGRSDRVYALGLSATIADSSLKFRALGFLLGWHNWYNFKSWALKYGCRKSPFGYDQIMFDPRQSGWVIPQLREMLKPYGVRVTRDAVAQYLPDETIEIELWDVGSRPTGGPVFEALEALEKKRDEDLERHEDGVPGGIEKLRLWQEAELRKLPVLAEEIRTAVEGGMHCPVFLNFSASIDTLAGMLHDLGPEVYDGRANKAARQVSLDKFQANTLKVLILQVAAGSASIDLHDVLGGAPRMTFIAPTYNAESFLQSLGRAVRFGGRTPVIQRICFADKTAEKRVYAVAQRKADNIREINAGEWDAAAKAA
jgi:superfamily II DNA or RNA helicase